MSATEKHGISRDANIGTADTASEVFTETSGLTRGELMRRGLATGLAVGATSVFPGVALGATQPRKARRLQARRLRDQFADPTAIHPFQAGFSQAQLVDLRQRVTATRWPTKELVTDH